MNCQLERDLVDSFVRLLERSDSPWGEIAINREFDYSRGRTDVVAVTRPNVLIAFEAKLDDWKTALHQAYRNTCFAHRSYVLLPKRTALTAAAFRVEFEKRGVGLCYIDSTSLVIIVDSLYSAPLEPWLASQAISFARRSDEKICHLPASVWNH
jgi:hypothetical protein